MSVKKNLKTEYIILSTLMILALIVRVYKINSPIADWHSWRQSATASVGKIYLDEGLNLLYPKYYDISTAQTGYFNPEGYWFVEFPLFGFLHFSLASLFPGLDFVLAGRLVSITSSLFSILIIFLLGKKYLGNSGGLISAAFFAFLPFSIYYSRAILPEPLAVVLGLTSLWYFSMYCDEGDERHLWLSSVLFALALLVKPFIIFYSAPLVYLAMKRYGIKGLIKERKMWNYALMALAPLILWRLWMLQFPEGIPHNKWAFNGDGIRFRPAFWRWLFGERLGRLILGIWGLIPFIFGLLSQGKGRRLTLSFLLGSFLFVTIFATANVRHDYYQITVIPSLVLALSLGVSELWKTKTSRLLNRVVLVFSVGMMFGISWYQIREFYKVNRPEIVEAGRRLDKIAPRDALVIAPYNKDMAFLYQTGRRGWPFIDQSIDDMIKKGADYYVSVSLNDPVTLDVLERFDEVERGEKYVIVRLFSGPDQVVN